MARTRRQQRERQAAQEELRELGYTVERIEWEDGSGVAWRATAPVWHPQGRGAHRGVELGTMQTEDQAWLLVGLHATMIDDATRSVRRLALELGGDQ